MSKVRKNPHAGVAEGPQRDFIKRVHALAGPNRQHHRIFEDLVELAYCALAQPCAGPERRDELEARYMARVKAAGDDDYVRALPELLGLIGSAFVADANRAGDFLGRVAGELGVFNEGLGQFMTPWEVGKALAAMTLSHADELLAQRGFLALAEPACGTGGLILAAAQALREAGKNPAEMLFATAVDISPIMYQACFVQLSMAGLPACVCLGDSLSSDPSREFAYTPATLGFIARHKAAWLSWHGKGPAPEPRPDEAPGPPGGPPPAPVPPPVNRPPAARQPAPAQLDLFGEG